MPPPRRLDDPEAPSLDRDWLGGLSLRSGFRVQAPLIDAAGAGVCARLSADSQTPMSAVTKTTSPGKNNPRTAFTELLARRAGFGRHVRLWHPHPGASMKVL